MYLYFLVEYGKLLQTTTHFKTDTQQTNMHSHNINLISIFKYVHREYPHDSYFPHILIQ